MGLSPLELAVVFLVVMLLFGVKRLPELGSGLGQAISNFKKSYKDGLAVDVTPKTEEQAKLEADLAPAHKALRRYGMARLDPAARRQGSLC